MAFPLSALRNTQVYYDLALACRSYSVLISPTPRLDNGGSGSLVRYKDFYGILTATHVIVDYLGASRIYSPISRTADPTVFLNKEIPIKKFIYLETPEGIAALRGKKWPEGALDICLIQIEKKAFNLIQEESGKKAIDLLIYKQRYHANFEKYCAHASMQDWSWAVDGAPREGAFYNSQGVLESKHDGLFVCGGAMAVDAITYKTRPLTLVCPPFDKIADIGCHDLSPTTDRLPSKFSGISGEGMCQVSFEGTYGKPEKIHELFFCGICVAETDQALYSRGPTSLYDIFVEYLDILN